MGALTAHGDDPQQSIPHTDLSFDVRNEQDSVLRLVYWIRPKWRNCSAELKITKFTDGITNTVSERNFHIGHVLRLTCASY